MIPIRDTIRSRKIPVVTWMLIILNILVFLLQNSLTGEARYVFIYSWAVIPALGLSQIWRWITATFLHGSFGHLAGNMVYLWIFGDNVEDSMGRGKFLLFYLLMGFISSGVQVLSDSLSPVPVIGASGAVAGILGAYYVLYPYSRIVTLMPAFFFRVVHIPAGFYLIFWFAIQFVSGITESPGTSVIAWWAHIGGFVAGAALAKLFRKPPIRYYYYE